MISPYGHQNTTSAVPIVKRKNNLKEKHNYKKYPTGHDLW